MYFSAILAIFMFAILVLRYYTYLNFIYSKFSSLPYLFLVYVLAIENKY